MEGFCFVAEIGGLLVAIFNTACVAAPVLFVCVFVDGEGALDDGALTKGAVVAE